MAVCRFWGWTPRQVDELTPAEYRAALARITWEDRERKRQERAAARKARR